MKVLEKQGQIQPRGKWPRRDIKSGETFFRFGLCKDWKGDCPKEIATILQLNEVKMKRKLFGVLGIMILLGMPSIPWGTEEAVAGVGVSVNIGLPPLVFAAPPALIVIPGTYVYSVP